MTSFLAISLLAIAIAIIIVLCICFKVHAFIALMTACFFLALATGVPLEQVGSTIESGIGGTLGFLAPILGLGAILGKMMEVSGGAERLAKTLINFMGKKRASWAMLIVAYLCGIPVFFQVGIVLLTGLMFSVCKEAKIPVIQIGLSMVAGLVTVHCIVPPHPAAMAITLSLNADVGRVIFYGLLIGFPAAAVAGPIYGKFCANKYDIPITGPYANSQARAESDLPPFFTTLFVILLPLLLMVSKTILEVAGSKDASYMPLVSFIGNPVTALFISVIVAYFVLGLKRGFSLEQLNKVSEGSLSPMASILLIIAAAGAFNKVILVSGLGKSLEEVLTHIAISPLIMAWLIALLMRFAIGSATVAMMTAAGLMQPLLGVYPGLDPALLAIAIGAGSIGASHVTDSGFWFVKESLGIPLGTMYATYTVSTCIASVLGLAGTLVVNSMIS